MADIELVIKIPEELLGKIDGENYQSVISWYDTTLYCAIKDGKPLLQGHGDLIDRTEVIKSLFDYHNGKKTIGQCIDDVPTIIDADKENE